MAKPNIKAISYIRNQKRPENAHLVFSGKIFEVWQWEQELFDGTKAIFENLRRPDTVLILPILRNGFVLLAEESQPGTLPMLRSLGGRIEKNESPEDAAKRELLEESGYTAKRLKLWDAWQPINKIDWTVYLYVAHDLQLSGNTNFDSGEKIRLQSISISKLLEKDSDLILDDYELSYKLYFAKSDSREYKRVLNLFNPLI